MKKFLTAGLIALVVLMIIASSLSYWLFYTTNGSEFVVKALLARFAGSQKITIGIIEGALSNTVSLRGIKAENLQNLPEKSSLEINKLDISVRSFILKKIDVNIHNGKLNVPETVAVYFHGEYLNGYLDINIYSESMDIQTAVNLFGRGKGLKNIKGRLSNPDILISGTILEPEVKGDAHIEKFIRDNVVVLNCPLYFKLNFKNLRNPDVYGEVVLKGGTISGKRTAVININESRIFFKGNPMAPVLNFSGTSTVEDVKIDVAVKGTMKEYNLILSSTPAMPRERLLIMLATNKSWKGIEQAAKNGVASVDLAGDFISYFLFAETGEKVADSLGLKGASLKFNEKEKSLGLKKDIYGKAKVGYSITESQETKEKKDVTHTVGGGYNITDGLKVEAERELKQEVNTGETEAQKADMTKNDKVLLKYKKKF